MVRIISKPQVDLDNGVLGRKARRLIVVTGMPDQKGKLYVHMGGRTLTDNVNYAYHDVKDKGKLVVRDLKRYAPAARKLTFKFTKKGAT